MKKYLSLILCIIFILSGCDKKDEIKSFKVDMSGYTNLDSQYYDVFKGIEIDSVEYIVTNEKSAFIYLGDTGCESCQKVLPKLAKAASEAGVTVYYLNILTLTKDPEVFAKTVTLFNEALRNGTDNNKVLSAPEIIKFENGKIVNYQIGSNFNRLDEFFNNE